MEGYEGLNKSRELRLELCQLDHVGSSKALFFSGSMLRRHCEILLCGKDAIFIVFVQKQMKCPLCCCVCLEPDLFFFGSFYHSKPLLTVGVACAVSSSVKQGILPFRVVRRPSR